MAIPRFACAVMGACAAAAACGTSPCGLRLQEHLFLPPAVVVNGVPRQRDAELSCCGASVSRDVDLDVDGLEVDLTNPNGAGVDGFLTSAGCDTLFSGPYSGSGATPLCQVQLGPVRPRGTSERKKLPAGRYRIFAQGYTVNDAPLMISLDLGVWSSACRWNPIGP
jgi:hypothetical protein